MFKTHLHLFSRMRDLEVVGVGEDRYKESPDDMEQRTGLCACWHHDYHLETAIGALADSRVSKCEGLLQGRR